MLTATYLTNCFALRPEFCNEVDKGDLSAPERIAAGSYVCVESYSKPGTYYPLPSAHDRFNPFAK